MREYRSEAELPSTHTFQGTFYFKAPMQEIIVFPCLMHSQLPRLTCVQLTAAVDPASLVADIHTRESVRPREREGGEREREREGGGGSVRALPESAVYYYFRFCLAFSLPLVQLGVYLASVDTDNDNSAFPPPIQRRSSDYLTAPERQHSADSLPSSGTPAERKNSNNANRDERQEPLFFRTTGEVHVGCFGLPPFLVSL